MEIYDKTRQGQDMMQMLTPDATLEWILLISFMAQLVVSPLNIAQRTENLNISQ